DIELEAALRHLGGKGERRSGAFHHLVGEADGLMNLGAGHVRYRAQVGVADHVQIGESGETERLTQAPAAGRFKVEERVGFSLWVAAQLRGEIERAEQ